MKGDRMNKRQLLSLLALAMGLGLAPPGMAAPPKDADVGDADSFGKRMRWLGMVQTGQVILADDCTPVPGEPPRGPDDHCVVLNGGGAPTEVSFVDLGAITLPKDSADTLVCHWVTPFTFVGFFNPTAAPVLSIFRSSALFRIESPVLSDPSLVNPQTGLPFSGFIDVEISTSSDSGTLAAGAQQNHNIRSTRTCISGLVTKASLTRDYGLTDAQAKKFFKEPITIRAGIKATAQWVSGASILYGTRFTGDKE
jgi:hypothetical protein